MTPLSILCVALFISTAVLADLLIKAMARADRLRAPRAPAETVVIVDQDAGRSLEEARCAWSHVLRLKSLPRDEDAVAAYQAMHRALADRSIQTLRDGPHSQRRPLEKVA